ncbi:phosphoheptose isomerase [Sphingomonas paucimobilis]|uniref:Phosphoheptose isomerase n=2 Tax=Sphingomonas paucimobilis TaxID=13689 RepID=A0A7Y2KMY6_SPHPI|nr:phosphoheptose isomerase [Sphingomonas paucimobilis]
MGLREPITKDRLRAAAKDGSIVALLDWKPVRAGDFWYAPAGTIHAIGAGLSLIEIQQNVDVTYRLYDYGSNRELHLDEAVEAACPAPYEAPFAPFELARGRRVLAAGGSFVVERWADTCTGILAPRRGEPVWLIPLRGEAVVGSEPIEPGGVWIVAGDAGVNFTGSCDLLVAYSGRAVHEALISRSRNERQS